MGGRVSTAELEVHHPVLVQLSHGNEAFVGDTSTQLRDEGRGRGRLANVSFCEIEANATLHNQVELLLGCCKAEDEGLKGRNRPKRSEGGEKVSKSQTLVSIE